ncbi:MAG: ribonuclease HII [Myxococcota bacterium]|jgi:ribonuclease HII
MSRILGIDEAGRGCVLGALMVGAYIADDGTDAVLRAAGADDSKKLSAKRRVEARERLRALGTEDVVRISATEIDAANLNHLEEAAIVELIRRHSPDRVLLDALGHPRAIPAIVARLEAQTGVSIDMRPKADSLWPIVGAASIVAKTTRDAELDALNDEHGPLGSGYPSDPKTRRWLTEWSQSGRPWPEFVRTRWETVRLLSQSTMFG